MDIRPISNQLQEKAKSELNEVIERIPEDLEKIREWLLKQPHIVCRRDDQWLLSFLRSSKFSIERTKEKIDSYYTIRTLLPEFFKNRDPLGSGIQEILIAGHILPLLPQTVNNFGHRIILYRYTKDLIIPVDHLIKQYLMLVDILIAEDDNFTILGAFICFDFASFPLSYLFQLTPTVLKKIAVCIQNGYPARVHSIHFINTPPAVEHIISLLRTFISTKLKERIAVYSASNVKNFYKILPQKYMPLEYGGENGSIHDIKEYWKTKFEDYREWFLKEENYCTDEKLRPDKPKTSEELFGVEGSFRNLTVD